VSLPTATISPEALATIRDWTVDLARKWVPLRRVTVSLYHCVTVSLCHYVTVALATIRDWTD